MRVGSIEPMVSVAGRRVPLAEFVADCLDPAGDEELIAARPAVLAGGLDALRWAHLDLAEERVMPVLERWRAEYFATDQARVGPREAAAYHVAQHWNRARLGSARQARILDTLVGRRAG